MAGFYKTAIITRVPLFNGRKEGSHGKIHSPLKPKEFPNQGAEQRIRMCPRNTANHSNKKATKNYGAKGVAIWKQGKRWGTHQQRQGMLLSKGWKKERSTAYESMTSHRPIKSLEGKHVRDKKRTVALLFYCWWQHQVAKNRDGEVLNHFSNTLTSIASLNSSSGSASSASSTLPGERSYQHNDRREPQPFDTSHNQF